MKSYLSITPRYLKVQKKRTILTIIGIILSVSLIMGIGSIIVSMRDKMIRDAVRDTGEYHFLFKNVEGEAVDSIKQHVNTEGSALVQKEGFAIIAPFAEADETFEEKFPPHRYLSIKGYDAQALEMLPLRLMEGRLPQAPGEIVFDYWALEHMTGEIAIGDKISLGIGERKEENTGILLDEKSWTPDEVFEKTYENEYTIVGLLKPAFYSTMSHIANAVVYIGDSKTDMGDGKYDVYVKADSPTGAYEKGMAIVKDAGLDEHSIGFNDKVLRLYAESTDEILNGSIWTILLFIVSLVIISTIAVIYNAFNISVLERVSQFGVLRCVGASPTQIKRIVLREALTVSIIGVPLGLVSGALAMKIVFYVISLISRDEFLGDLQLVVSPEVLAISIVLGMVTVFLSAFGPARKAAKVSPLEAVRNAGSIKKEKIKKVNKSRLAGLLFGIEGQIAWKNLRRNRKRFIITVFSMVISIVLYIVFGSFATNIFKMNLAGESESGDFYVGKNGSQAFTAAEYEEIKNLPDVDAVYKYIVSDVELLLPEDKITTRFKEISPYAVQQKKGDSVILSSCNVLSYGDDGLDVLKGFLNSGAIDKEALDNEAGVILVNTGLLYEGNRNKPVFTDLTNLKVGDSVQVTNDFFVEDQEQRKYKTVKILGIVDKGILDEEYGQYGRIHLITTEQVMEEVFEKKDYYHTFIKLKPGAGNQAVNAYLKSLREKRPEFYYMDYAEQAQNLRSDLIVVNIFLYGFVAVITLIGCLNIINTISTNLLLRTRELSVMKAVGMSQNGIKKMVHLESAFYGIIAALYGSMLGTLLAYFLFGMMTDIRGFSWTIPWNHIVVGAVGAGLVAFLSGYVPLRRINKGIIIENIRMEQ